MYNMYRFMHGNVWTIIQYYFGMIFLKIITEEWLTIAIIALNNKFVVRPAYAMHAYRKY